jgi:Zn-dependent protease
MFSSWRLGPFPNIDTTIHWSFWLIVLWVLGRTDFRDGLTGLGSAFQLLVVLLASVYLHALGHTLAAGRQSQTLTTRWLLPYGEYLPFRGGRWPPRQALIIASGGPVIQAAIAGTLALLWYLDPTPIVFQAPLLQQPWYAQIFWVNLTLLAINLLPIYPMDGGRFLQAILEQRWSRVAAVQLVARLGRYLAVLLVVAGLGWNWLFGCLAVAVFLSSLREQLWAHSEAWTEDLAPPSSPFGGFPFPPGIWVGQFEYRSGPGQAEDPPGHPFPQRDRETLEADEVRRIE